MEEQLLTVEEVAQRLRRRPFTIRRLLREGKIPAYKQGGEWLVKQSQVEAYLETQRYKPRKP